MGREIRKVPAGWEHPRYDQDDAPSPRNIGRYRPLHDDNYEEALKDWCENGLLWLAGTHPDWKSGMPYEEWFGTSPKMEDHRTYKDEDCTHFQMYETVSEGTPCTPVFATLQELEDWLVDSGEMAGTEYERKYSRAAAHAFCQSGYAPSMVIMSGRVMDGVTASEFNAPK